MVFGYCIYECGVIYMVLVWGVCCCGCGGGGNPLPMGSGGVLN